MSPLATKTQEIPKNYNNMTTSELQQERKRTAQKMHYYENELQRLYPSHMRFDGCGGDWDTFTQRMRTLEKEIDEETELVNDLEARSVVCPRLRRHCIIAQKSLADLSSRYYQLDNAFQDYTELRRKYDLYKNMNSQVIQKIK